MTWLALPPELIETVVHLRSALGLSQESLARAAGLSKSTIQHLEGGRRVTTTTLAKISVGLGLDQRWLYLKVVELAAASEVA